MAKIAVLGYGVVGSGTVELFYKNKDSIIKKAGKDLDIKYILDIREFPGSPYESKFTKNIDDILNAMEREMNSGYDQKIRENLRQLTKQYLDGFMESLGE